MNSRAPTKNATRAAAFRLAAQDKEQRPDVFFGTCIHVCEAAEAFGVKPEEMMVPYKEVFAPDGMGNGNFWWPGYDVDQRILALCFMAAMVEAGDA